MIGYQSSCVYTLRPQRKADQQGNWRTRTRIEQKSSVFAMHVLVHYIDWIALIVRVVRLQMSFAMIVDLFQATEAIASNYSLDGKANPREEFHCSEN